MTIKSGQKNSFNKKSNDLFPQLFEYLHHYSLPILIFLTVLFILLLINRPALYLNDELIVVNQLHQINNGHQFLYNECKYGCYPNGTPSKYFEIKNNILGYTIFHPLLSLPALLFFSLFGDQFRLPIILIWSLIPLLITIIICTEYLRYSRIFGIPLLYIGALISMLLLMINLYYYHPFPFTVSDAPIESGAVIITNTIAGALLSVVIYQIAQLMWTNKKISLLCTLSILCCSSFLFWSGTAKDHIIQTLILSLIVFFLIKSIIFEKTRDLYLGFLIVGLLAWIRPEMGISIFMGMILFLFLDRMVDNDFRDLFTFPIKKLFICILSTIIGSIPLFINNYITTNNVFIPPFFFYNQRITSLVDISPSIDVGTISSSNETISSIIHNNSSFIFDSISLVVSYFIDAPFQSFIPSIVAIFIYPQSGNMSLAAVSPLFLVGGIILTGYSLWKRPVFDKSDIKVLIFIIIMILCSIIAYIQAIPGISRSGGIVPDMRYFLPLYLLGGLLGFYALERWGKEIVIQLSSGWRMTLIPIFAIFITFIVVFTMPGASYRDYTSVYMSLIYGVSILFVILFFGSQKINIPTFWKVGILIILLSLPLSWQLLMDLFYSIGKMFGYPPWIPYLEYLTEKYVSYNIII